MSTIVTRAGKGSPLTHNEVDANFTNLNTDKVEKTSADITGGTINNTTIGATTPSTVNATTLSGETGVLRGTGQNFHTQSQTFESASWTKSGNALITADQVAAPDGTTTADYFYATSPSAAFVSVVQAFNCTTNQTYTFSLYVRSAERTTATIQVFGNSSSFISSVDATSLTSAWTRLTLTINSSTFTSLQLRILFSGSSVTWSGSQGIYIWGAQAELASTAGTYLATTTTAVYGTPTLSFSGVSTIGLQSNGALFLQPAGTGAIQAQATTSTTAGGNVRGANAVDWQTIRGTAGQVAGNQYSVLSGGVSNTASGVGSVVSGGFSNNNIAAYAVIAGGQSNTQSSNFAGTYSVISGGFTNSANGYFNLIGGGFTNSGTSGSAVTTQSGTMNATTAVTLSGSNANIKVGQYITGTSIAGDTYVAAISGTSLTLSKNASGSSTSTLSFFTPHGVVVGGGNNQATGSYSFIGGGGDAGTAANRNVASGDWSFVGGGRGNTASGLSSVVVGGGINPNSGSTEANSASGGSCFVGGGAGNTATATVFASVVGGRQNAANSNYGIVAGGAYGTTRGIIGNTVFPASATPIGTFAQGSSQSAMLVLARQTTDATATVLASDSNAASTNNQVILPNNSAYFFRGEVISGVTGGGNTKGWTIEGVIKRGANAASTALVGTPTVTSSFADAGASTWVIAVTADTTNGGLRVTFTGQAATTIRTVCQIRTTEMTF